MRLLWVVPDVPVRGVMAAGARWWNLLARLATRHEITLLAFVHPEDLGTHDLPPGLSAAHLVPRTAWRPDDPLALLPRTVAGGFTSPALRTAIAARLAAERFDIVQYEYSEMAHCIPWPAARSILTVHQLAFAQEGPLWRAARGGARQAAVLLHRYLRELDFELRAVRRADHVVTMSPEDAARLRRFDPTLGVSVSPCGVDCEAFQPPRTPASPDVDLLFVGNFAHPPNADAVKFLVREIVPRLGRPLRVRVVGRGVTPEVSALARSGNVEITGAVADVRPHLSAAAVFVAPVRFGTGMRGKTLEALAMARPVVTTSVGAEGLGAVPGRHLLVADDADDFAAAVRRVLDDPTLGARLGAAGRALVEARFDWDTIAAAHDDIYTRVLTGPSRAEPPRREPRLLAALAGRLGYVPGVAAGCALLAMRGLGWYLRRVRGGPRSPMPRARIEGEHAA